MFQTIFTAAAAMGGAWFGTKVANSSNGQLSDLIRIPCEAVCAAARSVSDGIARINESR